MNPKKTLVGGFGAPSLAAKEIERTILELERLGVPIPNRAPRRFDPLATTVVESHAAHVIDRRTAARIDRGAVEARRRLGILPLRLRLRLTRRNLGLIAAGVVLSVASIAVYESVGSGRRPDQASPARADRTALAPSATRPNRVLPTAAQPSAATAPPRRLPPAALTPALAPTHAAAPAPATAAGASPAEAARAFALGDELRALELYRRLARLDPEQAAYPIMVGVLSARTREH